MKKKNSKKKKNILNSSKIFCHIAVKFKYTLSVPLGFCDFSEINQANSSILEKAAVNFSEDLGQDALCDIFTTHIQPKASLSMNTVIIESNYKCDFTRNACIFINSYSLLQKSTKTLQVAS